MVYHIKSLPFQKIVSISSALKDIKSCEFNKVYLTAGTIYGFKLVC